MADRFELSAIIKVLDNATQPLRKIGRSFGKLSINVDEMNTKLRNVSKATQDVGKNMSTRITLPVAALGTMAVRTAAKMESLNAEFEVMLGSPEKAQEMVKQLTNFAATTPFELEGLAKNTRTLLAFGISADRVMPTLQMLGDVAGSDKLKFESLTLAFSQMQSAGKLMGQDLLQMINAGFNPLKILAEESGKSIGFMKEEMSKGRVSSEDVTRAFEIATSKGGLFFQNMQKQSETFNGLMSTLKDNVTQTLNEFGMFIIKAFDLKNVLKDMITVVSDVAKRFKEFISNNPELGKIILIITGIVAAMGPLIFVLGTVGKYLSFAITGVKLFGSILVGLAKGIMFVAKAVMFLSKTLIGLARFMLANPILLVITAIALAAFLIIKYWKPIRKFFEDLWNDIVDIAKVVGGKLFDWLIQPYIDIWNYASYIFDKIKEGIRELTGFLPDWAKEKLGLKATVEENEFSPESMKRSIESKSETDVTIRVESDQGTTTTIKKVKTKGTNKPKIENQSMLGPTLAFGN